MATDTKKKDSNVLKVNADDLTLGEIELIEEVSGSPIGYMGQENKPQGKIMVAIAYVMGLRDNPDYTLDDARKMRIEVESPGNPPEQPETDS